MPRRTVDSGPLRGGAGRTLAAVLLATAAGCAYVALPFGWTVNFPGFSGAPIPESEVGSRLRVPAGFTIETWASGIPNARMLRFTPAGDLLVSSPRQGRVLLLERDADGDGRSDGQRVLLEGLNSPHGLVVEDGWLYVAETEAVLRFRFDPAARAVHGPPERIVRGLPGGGNHFTRTIGIGPDGRLYVSIGSSCNVCLEEDPRRAAIVRYDRDGSHEEIFATGLRNAVGFDWQPGSGDLFATDNGRDLLGDDFPPCELDRVVQGGFYGWPFANGDRVPDPDLGAGHAAEISASVPPVHRFGAHVAPLGMTFYDATAFPERWRGAAFVAEHGSWNRSTKAGYQVVAVHLGPDGETREESFVTGFLDGEKVLGRPVDVAVAPDGALHVSDDFTGTVYRVAYAGDAAVAAAARAAPAATGGRLPTGSAPAQAGDRTAPSAREDAPRSDPLAGLGVDDRAAAIARGEALWRANDCARCHEAGRGLENPRLLDGLAARYSVEALAAFLRSPQPPMPVFPLTDAERRDLAIQLLATHP